MLLIHRDHRPRHAYRMLRQHRRRLSRFRDTASTTGEPRVSREKYLVFAVSGVRLSSSSEQCVARLRNGSRDEGRKTAGDNVRQVIDACAARSGER